MFTMELILYGAVVLVVVILLLNAFRFIRKPTTMRGYACKESQKMNITCNVDRIPKPLWQRVISFLVPLKYYVCHDCGKNFVRLQPIKKDHKSKFD